MQSGARRHEAVVSRDAQPESDVLAPAGGATVGWAKPDTPLKLLLAAHHF